MNSQQDNKQLVEVESAQKQKVEMIMGDKQIKQESCEGKQKQQVTVEIQSSLEKVMSSLQQQQQLSRFTYNPTIVDFTTNTRLASQDRKSLLSNYKNQIWSYLCSKLIMEQIIETIKTDKILDVELSHIQFMYMLSYRGFCQILNAMSAFSKQGRATLMKGGCQVDFVFKPGEESLAYLVNPMCKIYKKSKKYYDEYHKSLTDHENYLKNRVANVWNLVFYKSFKYQKDKYLCGFEGTDYTRQDQIGYLNSQYLNEITKYLQGNRFGIRYEGMISKLKILKQLIEYDCPNFQTFDDFEDVKNALISKLCCSQKQIVSQNAQQKVQLKTQQKTEQNVQQKTQQDVQQKTEQKRQQDVQQGVGQKLGNEK